MTSLDRRRFLSRGAGIAAVGAGSGLLAALMPATVGAQEKVDIDALHTPAQLGDKILGNESAAVTVIEYASMSCPHCARFHIDTWKPFKEKYVDTGQVRFIFREYPINTPAIAVAMVARCAPAEQFFPIIDAYFAQQDTWLRAENLYASILDIAKQFGFSEKSFETCLKNQSLYDGLNAERARASEKFGVAGTPTFFINGVRDVGALTLEKLDGHIQPLL